METAREVDDARSAGAAHHDGSRRRGVGVRAADDAGADFPQPTVENVRELLPQLDESVAKRMRFSDR
jgi:hypothetical protein